MAPPHLGFFTYLRLKILAVLLRLASSFYHSRLLNAPHQGRQTLKIPSRDAGRYIPAHLYLPSSSSSKTNISSPTPIPVVINWHGSGFVLPHLGSDTTYCTHIVENTGIAVLDADYRKGPEDPFPAAVHDVEDVIRWVAGQPERFDIKRIALSGFSAGANLALGASSSANVLGVDADAKIQAVIAFYPVTDLSIAPEAKIAPRAHNRPIPAPLANFFNRCYIPESADKKDPRLSPSYTDQDAFPSTVVIFTCEGDTLAPEADALADRLNDGTRRVVHRRLEGVGHGFDKTNKEGTQDMKRRNESYSAVGEVLREVFKL